jgi:predicted aconitase with swiveling domain
VRRGYLANITIKCIPVVQGIARGEALVTRQPLCLYDSLDPKSGFIVNRRHELYGKNVSGKILIFPRGTGSSTSAATILEAIRCYKAPKAIINLETEPIIAVGAILAEKLYGKTIPIVHRPEKDPADLIETCDLIKVNAVEGRIELLKHHQKKGQQ